MSLIQVINKKGTGDNDPPKGFNSWLVYWEKLKSEKLVCAKDFYVIMMQLMEHMFSLKDKQAKNTLFHYVTIAIILQKLIRLRLMIMTCFQLKFNCL